VGTISEILTYQIQKKYFATISTSYSIQSNKLSIAFSTPSFDVKKYLDTLFFKSPVTLKVNLDGLNPYSFVVKQEGKVLNNAKLKNGFLLLEAYPHEGNIEVQFQFCTSLCFIEQPVSLQVTENEWSEFRVNVGGGDGNYTYQWLKNGKVLSNKVQSYLKFSKTLLSDSGAYSVIVFSGANADTSDIALLKVNEKIRSMAYNGSPIEIPGIIEIEDFDLGGQNVAYNDNDADNLFGFYRYEDVEISETMGRRFVYLESGEWLNYNVNVLNSGYYDFAIGLKSFMWDGYLQVFLDDSLVINQKCFPGKTNGDTIIDVKKVYLNAGTNRYIKVLNPSFNVFDMYSSPFMDFMFVFPSSIDGIQNESAFYQTIKITPNPVLFDSFVISNLLKGEILIYTHDGKEVYRDKIVSDQGHVTLSQQFDRGVYIIKNITDTNVNVVKFIIGK
jgi:hypothetical protein